MMSEELTPKPPPTHPSMAVEQAVQDLLWLARNDAWMGVARIIAERRAQLEQGWMAGEERGEHASRACTQAAVASYMAKEDSVPWDVVPPLAAEAGALCAAEIDNLAIEEALERLGRADGHG